MRKPVVMVLVLGVVGCVLDSDQTIPDSRVWNNSLEGSWVVVSAETDGAPVALSEYWFKELAFSRTEIRVVVSDKGYYLGAYKTSQKDGVGQIDYSGDHVVEIPGGKVWLLDDFVIWKGIYTVEEEILK